MMYGWRREQTAPSLAYRGGETSGKARQDKNWKAMMQEAESLFMKGEFEAALVMFHRVSRIVPNNNEVKRRISLCNETLASATKKPTDVSLDDEHDLSDGTSSAKPGKKKQKSMAEWARNLVSAKPRPTTSVVASLNNQRHVNVLNDMRRHMVTVAADLTPLKEKGAQPSAAKSRAVTGSAKQPIQVQPTFTTTPSANSYTRRREKTYDDLLSSEVTFIQNRKQFWEEQIPPHEKTKKTNRPSGAKKRNIDKELKEVIKSFDEARYKDCVEKGESVFEYIEDLTVIDMADIDQALCNLTNMLGRANSELQQYEEAVRWHLQEVALGERFKLPSVQEDAHRSVAVAYHKNGEYEKAVEHYNMRISFLTDLNEKTWCYQEMVHACQANGDMTEARKYATAAYDTAQESGDVQWKLAVSLLMAGLTETDQPYYVDENTLKDFRGTVQKVRHARFKSVYKGSNAVLTMQKKAKEKKGQQQQQQQHQQQQQQQQRQCQQNDQQQQLSRNEHQQQSPSQKPSQHQLQHKPQQSQQQQHQQQQRQQQPDEKQSQPYDEQQQQDSQHENYGDNAMDQRPQTSSSFKTQTSGRTIRTPSPTDENGWTRLFEEMVDEGDMELRPLNKRKTLNQVLIERSRQINKPKTANKSRKK